MTKLQLNKQQKYNALLNAGYKLFLDNGYENTSIAAISKEAGVAKGTFYLYFKDKNEIRDILIYNKCKEIFHITIFSILESKGDYSFEDQVVDFIDAVIEIVRNEPKLEIFVSKNITWPIIKQAIMGKNDSQRKKEIEDFLSQIIEPSKYKFKDVEIMIYMIVQMTATLTLNAITNKDPADINEMRPHIHQMIRLILREYMIKN